VLFVIERNGFTGTGNILDFAALFRCLTCGSSDSDKVIFDDVKSTPALGYMEIGNNTTW
jgi:hypothetical protein